MTMTDHEPIVSDLLTRTDLALPAMALDPGDVLAEAQRHHRRHVVGRNAAAVLLVAGAAVGVAQLGAGGDGGVAAPAGDTVELAEGLTVTVPIDPVAIETELGTAVDLDVPTADGGSYVALNTEQALEIRTVTDDGTLGDEVWVLAAEGTTPDHLQVADDTLLEVGLVPVDTTVTLVSTPWDDGATVRVSVPTATVEGLDDALYVVRIDGMPADGAWPTMTILLTAADGTITTESVPSPATPVAASRTLEVAVGSAVGVVETDAGPALDLGVPVPDGLVPGTDGQELTYALLPLPTVRVTVVGEESGAELAAAASPSLSLVALAPDGTVTSLDTPELESPPGESAVMAVTAVIGDEATSDVRGLGVAPDGATEITLVVERSWGTERIPIPTFQVPGLETDQWFFFFTLHDEAGDVTDGLVQAEATTPGGVTTTVWSLVGADTGAVGQ